MTFTSVTPGQVDAESPLDTTLMDLVRTNLDDHQSRLTTVESLTVSNGNSHDHAGGDGTPIPQSGIANSAIGQAQLKTATGSVSSTNATNLTLPGGLYGFYPQIRKTEGSEFAVRIAFNLSLVSYATNVHVDPLGAGTAEVQQTYIQSSPPYMLGGTPWGHFLFLLRDIATATVKAAYEAEDPPWAYNGAVWLPKDDVGRLSEVPHPFADYWQKDPAVDGLEIVMVDLIAYDTKAWKQDNAKLGKGILEDIGSVVKGKGKNKSHADYGLPAIPKFTDKVKIIMP